LLNQEPLTKGDQNDLIKEFLETINALVYWWHKA